MSAYNPPPGRCECCGRVKPLWTPAAIVDSIRSWAETHGKPPTRREWNYSGPGRPTSQTVCSVFGSWGKGMRSAGFSRRSGNRIEKHWTRARLIEALTDWRFVHGRWPTCGDWAYATPGHPNYSTVYHSFGSWPAGLLAAGKIPTTKRELRIAESRRKSGATLDVAA